LGKNLKSEISMNALYVQISPYIFENHLEAS